MNRVVGIDTSHWKDAPDGSPLPDFAAGADQYQFGIPKITNGYKYGLDRPGLDDYIDPEFMHAWTSLGEIGKPRAVFHYFESGTDGKKQAEIIYNALNKTGRLPELPIYLDVESNHAGLTISQYRAVLEKTIVNTENLTGHDVDIYTSASKWYQFVANPINGPTDLVRRGGGPRGLLVANYGVSKPAIPWDWERRFGPDAWDLWQTGTMLLPGFKGNVDRDVSFGDAAWFEQRFGVKIGPISPPPEPPPPPATSPERIRIRGLLDGETLRMRGAVWGDVNGMTWNGAVFGVMDVGLDAQGRIWYQIGPSIWVASWYCEAVS